MAKNLTIAKLWLFLLVHRREVLFDLQPNKNKGENKMQENELKYYEKTKKWDFSYIKLKTERDNTMNKTIITVVGKDTVGIIAKVCTYLADNGVNILDISQTIVQEYFNMMMIVDMQKAAKPFAEITEDLDKLGEEIGVKIKCQHEEIITIMHRI